jgi:hypothetical protein
MAKKSKLRRVVYWLIGLPLLLLVIYFSVEQAVLIKMRSDLKYVYGDDYAILRLHMGGETFAEPSLWRMLELVYDYNFTDGYEPQGSGHFTGKKYYLTLLVSDNKSIRSCNWSFRMFKLDFDTYEAAWDIIDNLPERTADLYRFTESSRVRRCGLWCCGENFNHCDTHFYYRAMSTDKERKNENIQTNDS